MNSLMKIGLFILAELLINRIINFIFRLIAKKNHSAYLHFFKSVINISVAIIVLYSLVQQFESGGNWYEQRQAAYGYPTFGGGNICVKVIIANMICNICCLGGGCCGGHGMYYY